MPEILNIVNLARWEWFRLRRRTAFPVLYGLALLVPVAVLVVGVILNSLKLDFLGPTNGLDGGYLEVGYFSLIVGSLGTVAPMLAVALAALLHAGDLQGGHCRTLAARGAPRSSILFAKLLTAALLLLAYHLLAYAMAGLTALAFPPNFDGWAAGLVDTATAFQNSLLYLALGVALSHWRQSTAFTVGVGIALIAFEATAYPIAGLIGDALQWPLAEVTAWTLRGVAQGLQGNNEVIDRAWYIPIVAGYAAALTAAALALFRKYDLRSGGE